MKNLYLKVDTTSKTAKEKFRSVVQLTMEEK